MYGRIDRNCNLHLGNESYYSGLIDAPHTQKLTLEMLKPYFQTSISDSDQEISVKHIYLSERMRNVLRPKKREEALEIGESVNAQKTELIVADLSEFGNQPTEILINQANEDVLRSFVANRFMFDAFTGEIAQGAHWMGCTVLVDNVHRSISDLNRGADCERVIDPAFHKKAIDKHYEQLRQVLQYHRCWDEEKKKASRPFLHMALHGMPDKKAEDENPCDIEIGTIFDELCTPAISQWFEETLRDELDHFGLHVKGEFPIVRKNVRYKGHASLLELRRRFGEHYYVIQVEFCKTLRKSFRKFLSVLLCEIIWQFARI